MQKYIKQYLDYLRIEKVLSERTIEIYTRDLSEFVKFIKKSSFNKLARAHIREFLCFLAEKNNQPITRRRKLTSLKNFFQFLESENLIKNNPVKNIAMPKVKEKEPSYLTEAELKKLIGIIKKDKSKHQKRNELIVTIFIETGIRISELVNLDVCDIDAKSKTIIVKRKGGQKQSIPINAKLARKIKQAYKNKEMDEPLFFSSFKKRITLKLAGITKPNISVHSIRHSFCSRLLEKGVNLKTIQILAGHKNISTTERYLHIDKSRLRKEVRLAEIN
ncbi:MAG: Tyrosine recombinase XerD subunit [Candidatus Moranbacteria bacterium GW2011_GWF2_35_54]|nr:MAG: Tyrosine recombinase XerD subunit [Candidatus Moranbacteria bacterium GW2011_GWF2_35_54]